MCSLSSDSLNSPLDSSKNESIKAWYNAIHDKIGTITLYRLLFPGPAMAAAGTAS
jgi:hypothetical protein